jgi:hypothetical protein
LQNIYPSRVAVFEKEILIKLERERSLIVKVSRHSVSVLIENVPRLLHACNALNMRLCDLMLAAAATYLASPLGQVDAPLHAKGWNASS